MIRRRSPCPPIRSRRKLKPITTYLVLVSLRDLGTIAMIDPVTGKVEWAACGPWYAQHDPQFLDNGHILLFDNLGSPHGSRVLEYDPETGGYPWWYPGENQMPFYTSERGMS